MTVLNQVDRFDLAMDVIDRVQRFQGTSGWARETLKNKLIEHRIYVRTHGEDMPEVRDWQWRPADGPEVKTEQPELNTPAD
jgi:xylulose-5-phosphate/fructose-6-phosphate phosphoketolase